MARIHEVMKPSVLRQRWPVIALAAIILAACGGDGPSEPPPPPPTPPPPPGVTLTSITPATLQPGQTASLVGTGFSATLTGNQVTIGGERVTVTEATATSIRVSIPSNVCLPTGSLPVVVRVGSLESNPLNHAFQSSAPALEATVGRLTLLDSPDALCLRFGATTTDEAYAFGVQSSSSSASQLTPVVASSTVPIGSEPALQTQVSPLMTAARQIEGPLVQSPRRERWRQHREAESSLRRQERALYPQLLNAAREARRSPTALEAAQAAVSIPNNVQVGDTVQIKVPDRNNLCSGFTQIRTVLRVIGQHGVWLDDVANPAGGLTTSHIQALSDRFDNQIYAVDVDWFGQPTDLDGNSRIAIVITKELNSQQGLLGFVSGPDLAPPSQCASSNSGEVFYGRAADPAGQFGEAYTVDEARLDAVQLIAHELTHIIQLGRRIQNPQSIAFPTSWELEGQATLAEEINGHAATGRAGGQNYGLDVAWTGFSPNLPAIPSDIAYYADLFIDLAIYYGLNFTDQEVFRTTDAPEQCSWLALRREGNDGPCLSGREVYGTAWSFLRWLTDHFGGPTPSGAQNLHRALINDSGAGGAGFATIVRVAGAPINTLLAQWAAMLYLDDRVSGLEPRLTMTSWNLFNAFQVVAGTQRQPLSLQPRARGFIGFTDNLSVRGGSSAYYTISGANRPPTYIRFRQPNGSQLPAGMQVWVVRTR